MLTIGRFGDANSVGVEQSGSTNARACFRRQSAAMKSVDTIGRRAPPAVHQTSTGSGPPSPGSQGLLQLDVSEDRARVRELAKDRVQTLNAKIKELQHARDALQRLAGKCAEGSTGPCPILTSFDV
jgi:MerR family transcriptional regulator, mercuric resistance operon regulatory protein